MIFKPMKREDVLKAIEGQKDILGPAVKDHESFFKRLSCPSCGGDVMPTLNTRQLYREGHLLPNYLGKCKACEAEFEPYTGIIVTLPAVT